MDSFGYFLNLKLFCNWGKKKKGKKMKEITTKINCLGFY